MFYTSKGVIVFVTQVTDLKGFHEFQSLISSVTLSPEYKYDSVIANKTKHTSRDNNFILNNFNSLPSEWMPFELKRNYTKVKDDTFDWKKWSTIIAVLFVVLLTICQVIDGMRSRRGETGEYINSERTVNCPYCHMSLPINSTKIGKKTCPGCRRIFTVK